MKSDLHEVVSSLDDFDNIQRKHNSNRRVVIRRSSSIITHVVQREIDEGGRDDGERKIEN